jgi:hypothetical protein
MYLCIWFTFVVLRSGYILSKSYIYIYIYNQNIIYVTYVEWYVFGVEKMFHVFIFEVL